MATDMTAKAYVGAGAREAPSEILDLMIAIAEHMAANGYVLRSGGSPGADVAFETGCGSGPKEIYLPFAGFNQNPSPLALTDELLHQIRRHPAWNALRTDLAAETPPVDLDSLPMQTQQLFA